MPTSGQERDCSRSVKPVHQLQNPADRLDPELVPVFVDEHGQVLGPSSSAAKNHAIQGTHKGKGGGAVAALVALLNGDPIQAFWSVAIFTATQQVDNHVITPLVQRARMNLSPLVIILALIIRGLVAGLLGVLVAVTTTAAIRIVVGTCGERGCWARPGARPVCI